MITLPYAERYVTSSQFAVQHLPSQVQHCRDAALELTGGRLVTWTRRAKARIPSTATHFFWAHGVSNRAQLDKLAKSESQRQSIAEEHWYFVTFGAFIYVKAFKDDLSDCEVRNFD